MSARTSFIFVFLLLFGYFFSYFLSKDNMLKKRLLLMVCFLIFSIVIVVLLLSSMDSPVIEKMLTWSGEIFVSLFATGTVSTGSTDAMKELFFIPIERTFLYGDGQYLSALGEYYMSTDIGYLRVLLYSGIIGSASFYMMFIYLFFILINSSYRSFGLSCSFPLLLFALGVFVVNAKGSIFFDGFTVFKFVALIAYWLEHNRVIAKRL